MRFFCYRSWFLLVLLSYVTHLNAAGEAYSPPDSPELFNKRKEKSLQQMPFLPGPFIGATFSVGLSSPSKGDSTAAFDFGVEMGYRNLPFGLWDMVDASLFYEAGKLGSSQADMFMPWSLNMKLGYGSPLGKGLKGLLFLGGGVANSSYEDSVEGKSPEHLFGGHFFAGYSLDFLMQESISLIIEARWSYYTFKLKKLEKADQILTKDTSLGFHIPKLTLSIRYNL